MKTEARIQQECIIWFNNTFPQLRGCLFHVPNENYGGPVIGKKLKALGVISGVSDLMFIHKGALLCIEMKNSTGVQSKNQKSWEKVVNNQNIPYKLCRDLDSFKQIVKNFIKITDEKNKKNILLDL